MGYERHNAILVTGSYGDYIDRAHARATQLGLDVTPIVNAMINGVRSFACMPDGSKEGWPDSEIGDERRAGMVEWLRGEAYDDGSTPLKWVEVQYGDEDLVTRIVQSSDEDKAKFYDTPAPPPSAPIIAATEYHPAIYRDGHRLVAGPSTPASDEPNKEKPNEPTTHLLVAVEDPPRRVYPPPAVDPKDITTQQLRRQSDLLQEANMFLQVEDDRARMERDLRDALSSLQGRVTELEQRLLYYGEHADSLKTFHRRYNEMGPTERERIVGRRRMGLAD